MKSTLILAVLAQRAMFRVIAPNAQKVSVRIGQGFDMTKGADKIWTVTMRP